MTASRPEGRPALSEGEQLALRAIERDLRTTNPELASAIARGIRSQHWRWKAILVLADVTGVLLVASGVLAGEADLATLGVLALAALIGTPIVVRRKKIRRLAERERT
ncbi:DUF3040 domain-containing protein [Amycolatopsis benzoatilytica]|uniref:DUF3040 domain-containing protein n=1 Tax=Amycolatopsis benzoatilytica TaxID=346045 RepID=UPI00035FBD9F|nr:DUF3040 domain-containing protein [Amycolatopsis benzoatilytica]